MESNMFDKNYERFEKAISIILLLFMGVVVVAATLELIWLLYKDIITPPSILLGLAELFDIFGLFMMVLIAIELMSSIHMYIKNKRIHVEIIFLIGITAVIRKVVILDSNATDPMYLIGLATLLGALSAGYYLIKKNRKESSRET